MPLCGRYIAAQEIEERERERERDREREETMPIDQWIEFDLSLFLFLLSQAKFGDFSPQVHTAEFLTSQGLLPCVIPDPLLPALPAATWNDRLLFHYAKRMRFPTLFLSFCFLSYYSASYFVFAAAPII